MISIICNVLEFVGSLFNGCNYFISHSMTVSLIPIDANPSSLPCRCQLTVRPWGMRASLTHANGDIFRGSKDGKRVLFHKPDPLSSAFGG